MRRPDLILAAAVAAACSVPVLAAPAAAEPLICVYDEGLEVGPYTVIPPTTVCLL